jgi:hypothetical protein
MRKRKSGGQQIGCGFLAWTGLGLLILFVINNTIVKILFSANLQNTDERLFQAAQFLLPIGMLFVEYWLFDSLKLTIRRLRPGRSKDSD